MDKDNAMSDAENKPPSVTGKVEDNSAFGIYLNEHPEFLTKIERIITKAASKWTQRFQLIDMAEDIAQELRLNLLRGTGGLKLLGLTDSNQIRYISKAARNQCQKKLDEFRDMLDALADKTLDIAASCPRPEQYLQQTPEEEQYKKADKYLKRLTALERKVYVMIVEDEMSLRAIGAQVGKSASGVLVIYNRACGKIKRYKANDKK